MSWRPTTVKWRQVSQSNRQSTIGIRQTRVSWSVTIVRRTTRWGVTARSPTMVTLHDTRFVECRWWNDGWTVKLSSLDGRRPPWHRPQVLLVCFVAWQMKPRLTPQHGHAMTTDKSADCWTFEGKTKGTCIENTQDCRLKSGSQHCEVGLESGCPPPPPSPPPPPQGSGSRDNDDDDV